MHYSLLIFLSFSFCFVCQFTACIVSCYLLLLIYYHSQQLVPEVTLQLEQIGQGQFYMHWRMQCLYIISL